MTTTSQTEFARQNGWDRSYVTELKRRGRLVMAGDAVDVEASLAALPYSKDKPLR